MAQVAAYHRPQDLDRAIELLAEPGRTALAGGTVVNADREPPAIEVVDLQAVGLDGIEPAGPDRVHIGAMVTLDRLGDGGDGLLPAWLAGLARSELPSTLRTLATVGGTVAAGGGESALLAGLLAAGATVELAEAGAAGAPANRAERPLADVLGSGLAPGSLVTAVTIDAVATGAVAATGRTPADVPIVAAVAVVAGGETRLALSGVAAQPVLVDPSDPQVAIDPPGDFRGSADYRRHLAEVLSARALEATRV